MARTLARLAQLAGGNLSGSPETEVSSIGLDSRSIAPGGMFAALPGLHAHGARFAADTPAAAVLTDAAGAEILDAAGDTRPRLVVEDIRAVLGTISAEIYDHPSADLTILGVTGTSGKTTTSYLLEAGLLAAGYQVGLIGTTGTRINRTPVPTSLTTPEAPKLQELFAQMRDQGVTHVVMEVSSHALALGRVQGTQFAVGGFTNLSQDHLDFHPTMEDYFLTKARLFNGPEAAAAAVICVDDSWGQRLVELSRAAGTPTAEVATAESAVTTNAGKVITAHHTAVEPTGEQHGVLSLEGKDYEFTVPLPGKFNVANAALAAGMAAAAGVDVETFLEGVAGVAVPGRMQRVDCGQDFVAVVDYAHKPAAVAAVLDTLCEQIQTSERPEGRIGIVIGAGGDRDSSKRPLMGQAAASRADYVAVTDDNPRTEDPAPIRAAVLAGAREAAAERDDEVTLAEYPSRAAAIDAAIQWAQPGDAIIVVGKGHEVGQIVGDTVHHFDDREEVQRALETKTSGSRPAGKEEA